MRRRRRESAAVPEVTTAPKPEQVTEPAPDPEPAPAPAPEATPAPEPVQEVVTSGAAARWPEILEQLRSIDLSAWIAARDATATDGVPDDDGNQVVVLHHHTGALANFINNPAHASAYRSAAQQAIGSPVTVRAVVGSSGKPEVEALAIQDVELPEDPEPEPTLESELEPPPGIESSAGTQGETGEPVSPTGPSIALARARAHSETDASAPGSATTSSKETPVAPKSSSLEAASTQVRDNRNTSDTSTGSPGELTGWRARMARNNPQSPQTTADASSFGGFDGVPLPDEPGEPWDDGSAGEASGEQAEPAQYDQDREAAEALAQLDNPDARTLDHRSALEIAGELLEGGLGAERTR